MAETTSAICFSIFLPRFLFLWNHQFHLHRPRYSVVEDSPRSIDRQDFLPANRTPPGARSFTKTKPNLNLEQRNYLISLHIKSIWQSFILQFLGFESKVVSVGKNAHLIQMDNDLPLILTIHLQSVAPIEGVIQHIG
ncbi:hypothetical protein CASFOL_034483 [Castilleja foliolosa]|uniref:Uncharacterized protein n=1 Tax=Castilleja foliolosa TaxID=1961234 RepID=A0ABD3BRE2_9LAMI